MIRLISKLPALAAFAVTLVLSGCATFGELPEPGDFAIHGIDVSKYQGEIDWASVKASGTRFVYIKATEGGDHDDIKFVDNWNGARAAGIPTGAYHFYYFCRPVSEQISWFKTHVPREPDALPIVLDMEWSHSKTCPIRPPADQIRAEMQQFLNEMEAYYGKRPAIYTTVDFHRDVLEGRFNGYAFWVRSVAGYPTTKYNKRRWTLWQYTATGRVAGIEGNVDRNVFRGSEWEFQSFIANGTPAPGY